MNNSIIFEQGAEIESDQWRLDMSRYGATLQAKNVRQVMFVHGTFVGDDPFGFFDFLSQMTAGYISPIIFNRLKQLGHGIVDYQLGDNGNYSEEYVTKFGKIMGGGICGSQDRLIWGSGNYHKARLEGALYLAQELTNRIIDKNIEPDERILLIGHSHAGQVFALLTTFLADGERSKNLYAFIAKGQEGAVKKAKLIENIETIRKVHLDFVTFGTPVRYTWGNYSRFNLLSIINHRANSRLKGLLTVEDGDYVQQWGVEGTDAIPPNLQEENELSIILGDAGTDRNAFIKSLQETQRRRPKLANSNNFAKNICVNYLDNATGLHWLDPLYSLEKIFGHGVYTKEYAMLFNTKLIVETLYS